MCEVGQDGKIYEAPVPKDDGDFLVGLVMVFLPHSLSASGRCISLPV